MSKIIDFLSGHVIFEEVESKFNGKLTAEFDLAWGRYIKAGGLTQSGGVAKKIWKTSLRQVKNKTNNPQKILILGLGGGSIAKISYSLWENAEITGVDIDENIVNLGKKYLGLSEIPVKIHFDDAINFVSKIKYKYDLICVDMYQGDIFPEKFESEEFLKKLKKILNKNGLIIFNRLFYSEKRILAYRFLKKVEKEFKKVEVLYPEANIMIIASAI